MPSCILDVPDSTQPIFQESTKEPRPSKNHNRIHSFDCPLEKPLLYFALSIS